MMPSQIDPQEFGEMRATVNQLSETVKELTSEVKALRGEISQAKGGWKVLVAVGAAGATLATAVAWIAENIQFRH